jgi:RNA polymerase sigma-70 factor (ECF subfamily)
MTAFPNPIDLNHGLRVPSQHANEGERNDLTFQDGTERRWISLAAAGDLPAFQKIIELHQDRIFRFCLRLLGCREDAAEACQDVFISAHKALSRYRHEAKFSTWLCQIALNRCRDARKKASSKFTRLCESLHDATNDPSSPAMPPDSLAEWADELELLEKGLQALATRHREILVLTCIECRSHAECSEILKCSERAVEGRLRRARAELSTWWQFHKSAGAATAKSL